MPWRGPEYEGGFPSLGWAVRDWIEEHCVVPDRRERGEPFHLTNEQLRFLVLFYRLTPEGRWFYPRGGQLRRPQKWGKGPLSATMICAEAVGPTEFAGWDAYGEPVGRPQATPWIQVTACSEAQTKNVWRALQPMIELGVLGVSFISDTGLTRINLPGGGLIEPVTASAGSRLGNTITFAVQDQTESWVESNHGRELADNQRRNLGGTGGRFLEICNAFDPGKNSVAQTTPTEPGVYIDAADPGLGDITVPEERRAVMRRVYGDSLTERGGWVDLDRIDIETEALLNRDPQQAERFYLGRDVAGAGHAFDINIVKSRRRYTVDVGGNAKPYRPAHGAWVVAGVDGALRNDALALVATEIKTGFTWPLDIQERPKDASDEYEHDLERADGALLEAFEEFRVWRVYIDPQWIDRLVERWTNRWGAQRIVKWFTNRPKNMAWAVRELEDAIANPTDGYSWSFDPDSVLGRVLAQHFANAHKEEVNEKDSDERPMHILAKDAKDSPNKKDGADAAVLAWKARSDAVELRIVQMDERPAPPPEPAAKTHLWQPGERVPSLAEIEGWHGENVPTGFMG